MPDAGIYFTIIKLPPRHDRRVRAVLLVVFAGCVNYDETVHVHVRDPAQVTVLEPTEHGVTLSREERTVTAHCAWCEYDDQRFVVTPWASVDLVGDADTIERVGSDVHMRYAYVAPLPCYRRSGLCERPAFSIDVTTPRSNITAIDFERRVSRAHGEMIGAKAGIVAGVFANLVGGALLTYDIGWVRSRRGLIGGIAAGFLTIGTMFTVTGVRTLAANDSVTALPP
jgi:hypothetical protein